MFYADFVLSKKGPLARIWLAAHWDRKLTKSQVFETNIEKSVDGILQPSVKMALRTSGHLLLGVVRIYSRKAKYLLADCNEAFVKIKMAFRPGMVDLPEDHREAAVNAVTLPEVFHDFDSSMPDFKYVWNDVDIEVQFAMNQSRADEITMREDFGTMIMPPSLVGEEQLMAEVGFDGAGVASASASTSEILRHADTFDHSMHQPTNLLFGELASSSKKRAIGGTADGSDQKGADEENTSADLLNIVEKIKDSNYASADVHANDQIEQTGGGLFEGGLFDDTPMPDVPMIEPDSCHESASNDRFLPPQLLQGTEGRPFNDDFDDDNDNFMPSSPAYGSSDRSRSPSPGGVVATEKRTEEGANDARIAQLSGPESDTGLLNAINLEHDAATEVNNFERPETNVVNAVDENHAVDQTTIAVNEEGTFALVPVEASAIKGISSKSSKRKRKLIIDDVKNISGEEMKAQLSDTTDIITTLDLAPPTKRLMHWKETGGVEKLFALPGKPIPSRLLFKNYQRHLTSKSAANEEIDEELQAELGVGDQAKENVPPFEMGPIEPSSIPQPSKRGRKRKHHIEDDLNISAEAAANKQEAQAVPAKKFATCLSPVPEGTNDEQQLDGGLLVVEQNIIADDDQRQQEATLGASISSPPPQPMDLDLQIDQSEPVAIASDAANDHLFVAGDVANIIAADETNEQLRMAMNGPQDQTQENHVFDHEQQQRAEIENIGDLVDPFAEEVNLNGNMTMVVGGCTPWHADDYENPPSVEPLYEQQAENETVEQFEERILNKRAAHLYQAIRMRVSTDSKTTFDQLIIRNSRKQVAQKFYSLLVLKKYRVLELSQNGAYSEVAISRGSNFDDPHL